MIDPPPDTITWSAPQGWWRGLPHSPRIMSGHQASLWHPGIAAKLFATSAIARQLVGSAHWLLVDSDAGDSLALRVPTSDLATRTIRLTTAPAAPRGVPTGMQRAAELRLPDLNAAHPAVKEPLSDLATRLAAAQPSEHGGTRAHQAWDLIETTRGLEAAASEVRLLATSTMRQHGPLEDVASAMLHDPVTCVSAYNAATKAVPEARVRPLRMERDRCEVPLWWLSMDSPRGPVWARRVGVAWRLEEQSGAMLAPRALLTTLLARGWLCDLFIHGMGGGVYDRVLENWLLGWQQSSTHAPRVRLAPAIVVSATLRLPLRVPSLPAGPTFHAARHDPTLLGERAAGERKRALAERIASLPRRSRARAEAFQEMQALLDRARAHHVHAIEAAREHDARTRDHQRQRATALDRTWACCLHAPGTLFDLAARIEQRVASEVRS